MEDLVEKLQLQLDEILLKFETIGLKELCSFTGVQELEYERKTRQQLIKVINGKVDNLTEDKDRTELLNNFIGKSKKVSSEPPVRRAATNNDRASICYKRYRPANIPH